MKPKRTRRLDPPQFRHNGSVPTGVHEASDVCRVTQDTFVAISDIRNTGGRVSLRGPRHDVFLDGVHAGESGLEGVTYSQPLHRLVVSDEERRKLFFYDWDGAESSTPRLTGTVSIPWAGKVNKGVEGLADLPAVFSPTQRDQLLLVKEGDPQQLAYLEADGSGTLKLIELDPRVYSACTDFSSIAIHPTTGHVWIASDETARAAELELVAGPNGIEAKLLHVEPLVDSAGRPLKRVEGIAFNDDGEMVVLTENEGALHRFVPRGVIGPSLAGP